MQIPPRICAISKTIFSNAFSLMKKFVFWFKLHWSLSLRVQLTISQHWFSWWLDTKQATSFYLGWGLLNQFPPFRYFPKFSSLSKHTLTVKYRVYIWQVSPQLSCGDTCQIWMWFKKSNMYFCEIENFAYRDINERSFSNPHPWSNADAYCRP